VKLTQGQFDALVSFAYKLGARALSTPTLLKKLNDGDSPVLLMSSRAGISLVAKYCLALRGVVRQNGHCSSRTAKNDLQLESRRGFAFTRRRSVHHLDDQPLPQ